MMHKQILLIGSIVLLAGCTNSEVPKGSHFEHDHDVPHHWPDDLADAATKIRKRLNPSDSQVAHKDHSNEHHEHEHEHEDHVPERQKTQDEIADIVSWIPEIAADTNLSEESWNKIDQAARSLSTSLKAADNELKSDNELSSDNQELALALCQLIDQLLQNLPENFQH